MFSTLTVVLAVLVLVASLVRWVYRLGYQHGREEMRREVLDVVREADQREASPVRDAFPVPFQSQSE